MRRIEFLDTTLRDGNKLPFIIMNVNDRLEIAHQLVKLGVDIIDAGYPTKSKRDKELISLLAGEIKGTCISALSRAILSDIEMTLEILNGVHNKCIHIFMPISEQFINDVLKKSKLEVLSMARKSVETALQAGIKVQFSLSEFPHSDSEFMLDALETVCGAGTNIVSLADTNGVLFPFQVEKTIKESVKKIRGYIKKGVRLGVHFHNDFGVATANTLSAVLNGANHVEATIGGLGARAGNTALEEVAFGLEALKNDFKIEHGINLKEIGYTSQLVSHLTGVTPHLNKPIIGKCAYIEPKGSRCRLALSAEIKKLMESAASGQKSHEIFSDREIEKNEFIEKLKKYKLYEREIDNQKLYELFIRNMARQGYIYISDIEAIIEDLKIESKPEYKLKSFSVMTGSSVLPVGLVEIIKNKKKYIQSANGTGPVDALCKAIDKIAGFTPELLLYTVDMVTEGLDARADITVTLQYKGRRFHGHFGSTDVIEASAGAYLNAVNRIVSSKILENEETFYINGEMLWE
ncbi:MAG: hypothetical protein J7K04_04100 [Spirochaetales bacterium]|nr:hypothetical protein [Spirochaetales bacterium]